GYSVNIKNRDGEKIVNIPLEATGSNYAQDIFTKTKSVTHEFTTGDFAGDYYITLEKGDGFKEVILDNIYVKEIDKSIESPELAHVNLNTVEHDLEVGQSVPFAINALMNNGANVNLEEAEVEYKVSKAEVLTIENGMMTGASEGFTDVQVNITVNGNKVSSNTVRVKVGNPEVEEEEVIVNPVRNFKVTDKTKKNVTVSWEEPEKTYGLESYVLYKDGKKVKEIGADKTEFTFKGLNRHTIYNFKIAAKYSNGELSTKESITVRTAR
ncbi:MAG: fibronectin type III domain-containing protein, partial [Clostridium perfringens]